MLGRVIHKLILACSVLCAIALIALAIQCRLHGDLLVCGARFGTYHELRADAHGVSWMNLAGWPTSNDPLQWGRAMPKPPTISNWSEVVKASRVVPLIDGVQVQLVAKRPASASWWWPPPWIGSAGTATMHEPTEKYLRVFHSRVRAAVAIAAAGATPTMPSSTSRTTPTSTTHPATDPARLYAATTSPTTTRTVARAAATLPANSNNNIPGMSGSGTINFAGPMTLSLSPPPAGATPVGSGGAGGGGLMATIQGTTSLSITRTAPPAAPANGGWSVIASNMTVRLTPTFAYERIDLPYFAAVALVLTPAWLTGFVALARARRRFVRRRRGLCVNCGYDLRGSAFDSACPECGIVIQRDRRREQTTPAAT